MARRKVSVDLELDTARYNQSASSAAATTRTVSAAIEDLGDEADEAGRDLSQLAANTTVAAERVDELGDEARETTAELALLDARIDSVKRNVHALGLEFARTADAATGKQLDQERSLLGKLTRLRKEHTPDDYIPDVLENLVSDIGSLPSKLRGAGWLGAIVGGGAALPALSATVAGAVVGAVGFGGVIGGAFAAWQNPQTKAAWAGIGDDIKAELLDVGDEIGPAYARAAQTALSAWRQSGIAEYLRQAQVLVDPATAGVTGFGVEFGRGLLGSLPGQLRVLQELSTELPETGGAVADMLVAWSDAGASAAIGLGDTLDVVQALIRQGAFASAGLADLYAATRNPFLGETMEILGPGLVSSFPRFLRELKSRDWSALGGAGFEMRAGRLNPLIAEMREFQAAQLASRQAELDWSDAVSASMAAASGAADASREYSDKLLDLRESLKELGPTIDVNTRAGVENREAFHDVIAAAQELRDANIANEMPIGRANQLYREQVAAIEKLAGALGISKAKLIEIAGEYRIDVIMTWREINRPGRFLPGGDFQVYGGRHLQGSIDDLALVSDANARRGSAFAGEGRMFGGPVWPGRTYAINEHLHGGRPVETVTFPAGGMVSPAGLTPAGGSGRLIVDLQVNGRTVRTLAIDDALARGVSREKIEVGYP